MPQFFVLLASALSLIATTVSILVGYSTLRQRKNAPGEKRLADWESWRTQINEHLLSVDRKLDNDYRRLMQMDEQAIESREFQRIMLRSMKGILDISACDSANEGIRRISAEIDDFLIRR